MNQKLFSIITIVNNFEIFDNWLYPSLIKQTMWPLCELIVIDNTKNKWSSAASAFNYYGRKAKGKYLLLAHQDVELVDNNYLERAFYFLNKLSQNLGVAGVAGVKEGCEKNFIDLLRGKVEHPNGNWPGKIGCSPEEVATVDELLFIVPKEVFERVSFDEITCFHWHLYAVDFCLACRKAGLSVIVLPLHTRHRSAGDFARDLKTFLIRKGRLPSEYYISMRNLIEKYNKDYKYISTTCGQWRTDIPFGFQRLIKLINDDIFKAGIRLLWHKTAMKKK